MRPVPQIALDFIEGAEGLRLEAYRDGTGRPTIGWGHTGADVFMGQKITMAQAQSFAFSDTVKAAIKLAMVVKDSTIAALSEHQYSALLAFVFNLGEDPKWHIWGLLNTGNIAAVPDQMMLFDKEHLNGQIVEVPGLHNRRAAEVTLWKTADVGAAIAVAQAAPVPPPPSSYTRDAVTPPSPQPVRPLGRQKSFVSSVLGTMAAGGVVWADQLKAGVKWLGEQMPDTAGQSTILTHLQSELPLALFALTIASAGFLALRQRLAKTS